MNRIFSIILVLGLFSLMLGCSQMAYQNGYVITTAQDTLRGSIADRNINSNPKMLERVVFKPEQGKKQKYTPIQLKGYQRGSSTFHSVRLEKKLTKLSKLSPPEVKQEFLRVVQPGFVTLYAHDFVDFDGPYYDFQYYLKRQDQNSFQRINVIRYRKQAQKIFFDNPEILQEITAGKWRYKEVVELVAEYNRRK